MKIFGRRTLAIYSAVCAMLFCEVAAGREREPEIGISWSLVSMSPPTLINMYRTPFRARQPFVPIALAATPSIGSIVCTYNFRIGSHAWLRTGLLFSHLRALDHFYSILGAVPLDQKDVAAIVELRLDYLERERVILYGSAGLAPGFRRTHVTGADGVARVSANHENGFWMQGHVTAIGCSVGGRLSASAELGYGYRGLVSLGAALRF